MRLQTYLLVLGVILTAVNALATDYSMFWISPRNVSFNGDFPEVFPMEKGDWADLETGVGSRSGRPIVHMDSKGLLWIVGGEANTYPLNAMWNYDPVQDQYRWVAGKPNSDEQYQNFGTMGVPGYDVFPGAAAVSSHAIDKNDNIWIYGSVDDNTMWMFNTTSRQFTYIGGNETSRDPIFGDLGVESKEFWPGQLQGACTVVDSKNNIWMLGGYTSGSLSNVWRYNISSRMWSLQWTTPDPSNQYPDYENKIWPGRWTPGCTIDENDRVWLFGGYSDTTPLNWNDMWSFDTKTVTWTVERETNETTLPGNVASFGTYNSNNYPCQRDYLNMVDRRDGTIMLFGGRVADVGSPLNDVWVFNKTSKLWKVVAGSPNNVNQDIEPVYGQYRGVGSQLGSRQAYGSESGLNAKGHLIIVGGEHRGYSLHFNDIWIIPQDQCLTNLHNCDPNASCTMGSWTYECTCNEGYTGDGKTCTVIPSPMAPISSPADNTNTPATPVSTPTMQTSGSVGTIVLFTYAIMVLLLVIG